MALRWKTVIVVLGVLAIPARADPPPRPLGSFDGAKVVARDAIYSGHEQDFYCGCGFSRAGKSGGTINAGRCGYAARKSPARGARLEWEHVVPASYFGRHRMCWKQGHARCVKSNGASYKGRACCAKVDKTFKRIEADLHNLAPAVGELNGDRSNLPYGVVAGEQRQYGRCDFEIGGKPRVTEPRPAVRGEAARIWLYMSDAYGIRLKPAEREMYDRWSEEQPVTRWEILRDKRIEAAQGNGNPFVRNR